MEVMGTQTVCAKISCVVCVCVCVCGHVYVVYADTNLYNDMGYDRYYKEKVDLWGHFQCPHNLKRL